MGISDTSRFSALIQVSRLCYVVWAIWSITLGVGLVRRGDSDPISLED